MKKIKLAVERKFPGDWQWRCPITLPKLPAKGTHKNFPWWLNKRAFPGKMWEKILPNGDDIQFTSDKAGRHLLPRGKPIINKQNKIIVIEVVVPRISNKRDAVIWAWYGLNQTRRKDADSKRT